MKSSILICLDHRILGMAACSHGLAWNGHVLPWVCLARPHAAMGCVGQWAWFDDMCCKFEWVLLIRVSIGVF